MAERTPPSWLQAGSHPAENDRLMMGGLLGNRAFTAFTPAIRSMAAGGAHGVVGDQDLAVSQVSGLTWQVGPGIAFVRGSENAAQSSYCCPNDANKSLTLSAGDPTNPRNDLIVVKVQDAFYSGSTNAFSIVVVQGTAAASPSDPALPANSLVLARIRVNANNASYVLTDVRTFAYGLGGVARCISTARPANPKVGDIAYEIDTGRHVYWNAPSSAWSRLSGGGYSTGLTAHKAGISISSRSTITFDTIDTVSLGDTFISVPATTFTIPSGLQGVWSVQVRALWGSGSTTVTPHLVTTGGNDQIGIGSGAGAGKVGTIGLTIYMAAGSQWYVDLEVASAFTGSCYVDAWRISG